LKYFNSLQSLHHWVNNQICSNDYRIFKLLLSGIKRENSCLLILKDRVKTYLRVLKMPLYLKVEKKVIKAIVCDSLSGQAVMKKYIKNYDNEKELFFLSTSITEPIYINSIKDFLRFMKYYLIALKDASFLVIIFNKISTKEFSHYLYLKTKILLYKPKKIYLVAPRSPELNLIGLFFSNCKKVKIDMIIGGNLEVNQRYGYYSNVRLCFTSKITQEEYKSFHKIGWINSDNVNVIVTGDTAQIEKQKNTNNFLYDVGVYSSGIWARNGLARCYNIDEIKENKDNYCKNTHAKIEMVTLSNLISMAKKYNFSLRIYLHPYEKELINTYSIYPPYWDHIDNENITIDRNLLHKNNFYEVKIGIVLMSAIFYDRWNKDLITLCFNTKKVKNMVGIPLKYLGKYSKYGFKNIKELEKKVLYQLKKEDNNELS